MSEQYRDNEEGVSRFRRGRYRTALSVFDDNVEWTIPGDSMISDNWRGKDDLSQLFMQLAEKSTAVEPNTFLSDGDVVVVLTEVTAGGETSQKADVFTFRDGKVIKAQSFGDTAMQERGFGKKQVVAG
jgi:uncharacterized protein